jgi:hypothetical protein
VVKGKSLTDEFASPARLRAPARALVEASSQLGLLTNSRDDNLRLGESVDDVFLPPGSQSLARHSIALGQKKPPLRSLPTDWA